MKQEFEWDKTKAETNQRKHKVSFDEAITVFDDPFLLTFPDPAHSYDEERKISIGASDQGADTRGHSHRPGQSNQAHQLSSSNSARAQSL